MATEIPINELLIDKIKVRFLTFVNKTDNCWEWTGTKAGGYGRFAIKYKKYAAHRVSYILFKGEIPLKFAIDHLCKNKICVNPEHLEAVSHKENTLRANHPISINAKKTHCSRGHEFTAETTGKQFNGGRVCLICRKLTNEQYHTKNREARNARDKAYYQAHKEERKAWQKAYYWSEKAKGIRH